MQNPVFSGIGHKTDSLVLDFAANRAFKTPTEVANFIINKSYTYEQRVLSSYTLIKEWYDKAMERRQSKLRLHMEGIANASNNFTRLRRGDLHTLMNRIVSLTVTCIHENYNTVSLVEQTIFQYSASMILTANETLKKNKELLYLLVNRAISRERNRLDTALVLVCSNSPKGILRKGFVITRISDRLYCGEE